MNSGMSAADHRAAMVDRPSASAMHRPAALATETLSGLVWASALLRGLEWPRARPLALSRPEARSGCNSLRHCPNNGWNGSGGSNDFCDSSGSDGQRTGWGRRGSSAARMSTVLCEARVRWQSLQRCPWALQQLLATKPSPSWRPALPKPTHSSRIHASPGSCGPHTLRTGNRVAHVC